MTEKKKQAITILLPIIACMICMTSLTLLGIKEYSRNAYDQISGFCYFMIEKNPESEQQVLSSLKEYYLEGTKEREGSDLLEEYGYRSSDFSKESISKLSGFSFTAFLVTALVFIFALEYREGHSKKRIRELTDYLEEINKGAGGSIIQFKEDEFSHLQDEIYKTVTELYQTREGAVKAKINFADNLANIAHQLKTPITAAFLSLRLAQQLSPNIYIGRIKSQLERLNGLELTGVQDSTVYEKTEAVSIVPKEAESKELKALGGALEIAGSSVSESRDSYLVKAPIVILDDDGFEAYCRQIGIEPELDGTIILNRIWDNKNSNFRYKEYIPFVEEEKTSILQSIGQEEGAGEVEIPVIAYTQKEPVLREEYDNFTLVYFIPLSFWKKIQSQIEENRSETYIRILTKEGTTYDSLSELENEIIRLTEKSYSVESENRIQEKLTNDNMLLGFKLILGAFCSLLAFIGIANVFSNTLGFLRQRKREFARYMSIGLTPGGMKKMFCIEALVIAGRPFLITLPITAVSVSFMIKASFLDPMEFIIKMPLIPMAVFLLLLFLFVGCAYYMGGKKY